MVKKVKGGRFGFTTFGQNKMLPTTFFGFTSNSNRVEAAGGIYKQSTEQWISDSWRLTKRNEIQFNYQYSVLNYIVNLSSFKMDRDPPVEEHWYSLFHRFRPWKRDFKQI